jgi:hypothetical protein
MLQPPKGLLIMLVSATRLRVRSLRHIPGVGLGIFGAIRQARTSPGFVAGKLLRDSHLTFWTITAWQDEPTMRAYRNSGAHKRLMPKLLDWCDEAVSGHWEQDSPDLPDWQTAFTRLAADGKLTKVKHPSDAHTSRTFIGPQRVTVTRELPLKPAS